jgi:nucleotide-binding universal stress UspA family protein
MTTGGSWHCPPRRIALGIDLGPASARAAALAGVLAEAFPAHVVAIHAEPFAPPPYFTFDQVDRLEEERRLAAAATTAEMRQFLGQGAGSAFDAVVANAEPVEALFEHAAGADLIVVGTHGRRGAGRWWLGSVADRIVRASTVPVLVTHAESTASVEAFARIGALADGAANGAARGCAAALAEAFHGAVVETGSVEACRRDVLESVSMLVVATDGANGGGRTASQVIGAALAGCTQPVLFIPGARRGEGRT